MLAEEPDVRKALVRFREGLGGNLRGAPSLLDLRLVLRPLATAPSKWLNVTDNQGHQRVASCTEEYASATASAPPTAASAPAAFASTAQMSLRVPVGSLVIA